jgi:peptide/nickel transport system substrate-binding protein
MARASGSDNPARPSISRRTFIATTAGAAAALALAACSSNGSSPTATTAASSAATTAPTTGQAATTAPATAAPATSAGTSAPGATVAAASATTGQAAASAPAVVVSKGTVTAVYPASLQTLDPNIGVTQITSTVMNHVYDQVLNLTPDGKLQPMLAESWRSIDPLTWEFKLRKGVKFHDGTPFNAEVLKFTIERILDPTYNSLQKTYWVPVTSITTPDELTCVIKTDQPMGTMLYTMALTSPVLPNVGKDPNKFPDKPIGTGPFKFVEWKKDDRITMEAFDGYWGGAPKVKQVIFRTIPELATRLTALKTGEIDVTVQIPPEDAKTLEATGNVTISRLETYRTNWLWMNGQRKPFTDVRVRQAIRYAVNMDDIVKSVLDGVGTKARAPIAPKVFGFNPNLPPYDFNPTKAKSLLAEAGFPNGFETTASGIGDIGGYTRFGDVSQVVMAQLGDVGIKVKPVTEDPATANKNLLDLNWDMTFAGSTATTGDADNGMGRLYLSTAKRTGWSNSDVDRLLLVGRQSSDQNERLKAYQDAEAILWQEGPSLWTYYQLDTVGVRKRVHGFVPRPDQLLLLRDVSVD